MIHSSRSSSVQAGILAGHRFGDSLFQRLNPMPFICRADPAVAAHLVHAPIDFNAMVVGITKFDGNLAARPAASLEINRHLMGAQMIARANNLIEGGYLESKMMQLFVCRLSRGRPDKRQAMMVRMAAQENHPTRHHLFEKNIRELKTEY